MLNPRVNARIEMLQQNEDEEARSGTRLCNHAWDSTCGARRLVQRAIGVQQWGRVREDNEARSSRRGNMMHGRALFLYTCCATVIARSVAGPTLTSWFTTYWRFFPIPGGGCVICNFLFYQIFGKYFLTFYPFLFGWKRKREPISTLILRPPIMGNYSNLELDLSHDVVFDNLTLFVF